MNIGEARKLGDVFLQFVNKDRDGFGLFSFVLKCSYAHERRIVARMHRRQAQMLFAVGNFVDARKNMFAASLLRSIEDLAQVPWPINSVSP